MTTPKPGFVVAADRDRAYDYVTSFFGLSRTEHQKGLIQLKDDEIIAAVVYDDFNGSNIFMHCAGKPGSKWLTRWFLHEAFKYPFITLGAKRITLWIETANAPSIRFAEHLGFKREATLERAAAKGGDVVVYRMFREECRYA